MKQASRKTPQRLLFHAAFEGIRFYEEHDRHVFILGAITIQWSTTERLLFEVYRMLTRFSRPVAETTFYALPTHHMRRSLVGRLLEQLPPDANTKAYILKTLERVKRCADRRNQLMHDTWLLDPESKAVMRQKAGFVPDGQDDMFNEPLESLAGLHRQIYRTNQRLAMAIVVLAVDGSRSRSSHADQEVEAAASDAN